MADVLIRNIPDEVIAAIDARAKRLGLSRNDYLRRLLERERADTSDQVTLDHFRQLSTRAADLADPDVVATAWS